MEYNQAGEREHYKTCGLAGPHDRRPRGAAKTTRRDQHRLGRGKTTGQRTKDGHSGGYRLLAGGNAVAGIGEGFGERLCGHRSWIETGLGRGRNAMGVWQNMVDGHRFAGAP